MGVCGGAAWRRCLWIMPGAKRLVSSTPRLSVAAMETEASIPGTTHCATAMVVVGLFRRRREAEMYRMGAKLSAGPSTANHTLERVIVPMIVPRARAVNGHGHPRPFSFFKTLTLRIVRRCYCRVLEN